MSPRPPPAVVTQISLPIPERIFGLPVGPIHLTPIQVCYHPDAGHWLEYVDGRSADELAARFPEQIQQARLETLHEYGKRQAISTRHQKRKQPDTNDAQPSQTAPLDPTRRTQAASETGTQFLRDQERAKQILADKRQPRRPSSAALEAPSHAIPAPIPTKPAPVPPRSPTDPIPVFVDDTPSTGTGAVTKKASPSSILRQDPEAAARLKQLQETSKRIRRNSELLVVGAPVANAVEAAVAAAIEAAVDAVAKAPSAVHRETQTSDFQPTTITEPQHALVQKNPSEP